MQRFASIARVISGEHDGALALLEERLTTIGDVRAAGSVLAWDRQTHMPPGGVRARAEQLATLRRLAHEMLASDATAELLARCDEPEPDSDAAALLRLARRDHDRAARLPATLVEETSRTASLGEATWERAREENDWTAFRPHLENMLELKRRAADLLGNGDHPYDAMLDLYEPGARVSRLRRTFAELKAGIVPLLREVSDATGGDPGAREAPLRGRFPEATQEAFGRAVAAGFGYDWSRGRQDRASHPFCINFGPDDVRITTRFDPNRLSVAFFATCHEAGHAMYEQGIDPSFSRTPLAGGVSMGVHESQSRLWENFVARSRPFWSYFYPQLRETFAGELNGVGIEDFYRAVNVVRPSEIRTEADELTYNLHVLLRFELEAELFEEELSVAELPEAWNAKTEEYLGFTPSNDAKGVLQDVHWSGGYFGYFPNYAVGNVLAAQLFEAAVEEHPEIPSGMERGDFAALLGWLREKVHRHGKKFDPDDLIERATGRPLETEPYLRYLRDKFGKLYGL